MKNPRALRPTLREVGPLPPADSPAVLFVDYDLLFAELLASRIRLKGFEAFAVSSSVAAVPLLRTGRVVVLVATHVELLDAARQKGIRTVLLADYIDAPVVLEARGHRVISRDMDRSFLADLLCAEARRHG